MEEKIYVIEVCGAERCGTAQGRSLRNAVHALVQSCTSHYLEFSYSFALKI
jgi:hypothetical protein